MPSGVFFCKGEPWCFSDFCAKGESLEEDFFYHDLCSIDAFDGEEMADRHEDALRNGTSYPINQSQMRDGCFSDEDIFLVYEKADLEFIEKLIQEAKKQ